MTGEETFGTLGYLWSGLYSSAAAAHDRQHTGLQCPSIRFHMQDGTRDIWALVQCSFNILGICQDGDLVDFCKFHTCSFKDG